LFPEYALYRPPTDMPPLSGKMSVRIWEGPPGAKKNLTFWFFSATLSKLLCVVNVRIVKLSTISDRQVWEDQTPTVLSAVPRPIYPFKKKAMGIPKVGLIAHERVCIRLVAWFKHLI